MAKAAEAVEATIAAEARLDARKLRADFPIFQQRFHGQPLAYLDSAVSAQKPRHVLDAQREFYETSYTNVHRGVYLLAERATERFEGAHGEVLSIAFAGKGQHQDAGGKAVHVAKNTSSVITSKSISKNGGRAGYRGLLEVAKGASGSKSKVVCDALILDEESRSDTYPYIQVDENDVDLGHEATVSKIGEEQLFYLMTRGLSEADASAMIVSGFVEPITKELPLEYAVEMNRLIQLQMEGSVG